ncbi:response regulator [Pseudodesulfovibrio sp. zrk46]|uniref:response regulator n=1 Tax=Pseudodesulfovibrio sp. zrk46 TaxID=2725288 RepID=UPI00144A1CAB|nr:response regulator [Pseudodesulfovibrio sp. zrk46]QJB55249.1 DUF3369 domain-containing protein [Pseudodesulfovibrio sp. zrk46]
MDDELIFADETDESPLQLEAKWKLLVVDDDEFVHKVTSMVLTDYEFEGFGLEILSAYSADEGRELLKQHPDTAVILLDVVMETPQAGLDLADWIRHDQGNKMIRIILRTGQPGEAPEKDVIVRYDINDYKEKSELTSLKLTTTVTTAIRSYRDIRTIEQNRMGLAQIVAASPTMFKTQSLCDFASGVLTQLASTLTIDQSSVYARMSGLAAAEQEGELTVIASTGKYKNMQGASVESLADVKARKDIAAALKQKKSFFSGESFVGYFRTGSGSENVIYMTTPRKLGDNDRTLIEIFSANIAVAFDNIDLNSVITETQRELLFTLGEVVETRSSETANHVRRVAEYSYLLGLKAGMSEEDAECLKLASPMHDVGKIGIPDSVLLKPGKLDADEFDIIKRHTLIGYEILRGSNRPIMQMAATVALQHHERWDGTGYPHGLKGEEIHLAGRITMIADVFDALATTRVYKDAWLLSDILNYLEDYKGTQFDPNLVDIFVNNLDEFLAIKQQLPDDD